MIQKNIIPMKKIFCAAILLQIAFFSIQSVQAQEWSQTTACPGWNNPANFGVGDANNYYQGQTGTKLGQNPPNVMTGYTDMSFNATMYTKAALANVTVDGGGDCATFPSGYPQNKGFAIMSGSGNDPNTGNQLPLVPTQFNTYDTTGAIVNTNLTKSIRIGDACGGTKATALYYNVKVTPQNAMFYIYYACVIEAPGHGTEDDPAFIIRVMKKNAQNQWVQISDTLAYMVPSTPSTMTGGTVTIGQNGWHSTPFGSYEDVYWKEWSKVALNLSNYLYQNLRIEVMISDCGYSQHFAYSYIAGECRQMKISSSGCPPGMATDVTTLKAPRDMLNYVWYASEYGLIPADEDPSNPIYTWRQITDDVSANGYDYPVQANDFQVTRRRLANGTSINVDSIGNFQTFRCRLTSALDPAKPFDSYLYATVQNTKPSMKVDSLLTCDGGITLVNTSEVPGDPTLVVPAQTTWNFFNNVSCEGTPIHTATGDTIHYQFNDTQMKGVLVRTVTTDASCYSEAAYSIHPRLSPDAGMTISEKVLCDDGATILTDTTSGANNRRTWYFRPANAPADDMTLSDSLMGEGETNRSVQRSFSHAVEPIELRVYNGTYCLDKYQDTVWCNTLVRDTVSVFLHPELEVTGDTIVCQGDSTDATVRAVGVDDCTYEWSLTYGQVTGGLPAGPHLRVVPYADKATYYVKVTSPQGCVAWDSIHAYMVRPRLSMVPDDGKICPGDVATLTGTNADHFSWTASPADPSLNGQENAFQISVSPSQTTVYTMVGYGANGCAATPLEKIVTIVPLAVSQVKLSPGYIDVEDPTVVMRDVSEYSVASTWLIADGTQLTGKEVSYSFENSIGFDSVNVTLTSYNELGCPQEYPFAIPVSVFTAWFPTIFTPGSNDGNSRFSLYTINEYQNFHIYIYNRRGELVFDSADPNFSWDGTCKGEPCQQGAYVYTCRFLKPGTTVIRTIKGSVTLVR